VELTPAAALFRSLGDPTRLAIVRRLAVEPARVTDLAPIHRSAVGAALNSIVCLDCGVRGGVRVGDRPASLSGCSCGSSRRGMG